MNAKRQELIDTAYRLFNEHGYHATGIDWILEEAHVSKATLYKYFPSKDELILAVLDYRHQDLLLKADEALAVSRQAEPVLAIFDVLHNWFQSRDFYGCNFIKASAEYATIKESIYQYAVEHKEKMRLLIKGYLKHSNKDALSHELCLLMDGAIVRAHTSGDKRAALRAKKIAECLLGKL